MTAEFDSTQPPEDARPSLDLEYPCPWRYRVIVEDVAAVSDAVASYFAGEVFQFTEGRASSAGRYVAMELEIEVRDEDHRLGVLSWLQTIDAVRFVL